MVEDGEWLRARGIGRERFAGYLADFLTTSGYSVERNDSADPATTRLTAELGRPNPAIPDSGRALEFRFFPTSGGAALSWVRPAEVAPADRARMDRFVREMTQHLERVVSTESHATAKVSRAPTAHLPWEASS